ncbi:MAG: prephenate/arogenate dehydrogenase family protein [Thermogutta sp.]
MAKQWECVAIVGVGLIGASIGQALLRRGLAKRVVGIARRQTTLRAARRVEAVTNTTIDPLKGVVDAELVVVCTPPDTVVDLVRRTAQHCPEGTLFTDVASTKAKIVEALDGTLPRGCRFLGSHPLAGSEKTGPSYADANLFEGRVTILTPTSRTNADDFDVLEAFWSSLGSVVIRMPPEEHDRALAETSHFPHVVAALLAGMLPEPFFRLTGTGFLDTTRIAAGDAEMWTQICMQNRRHLLEVCRKFGERLRNLAAALEKGDAPAVQQILTLGKKNRDALGS